MFAATEPWVSMAPLGQRTTRESTRGASPTEKSDAAAIRHTRRAIHLPQVGPTTNPGGEASTDGVGIADHTTASHTQPTVGTATIGVERLWVPSLIT